MALVVDIEKQLDLFPLQVQFEAKEGMLALLGASGCGKSMTLQCIAGIQKPDKGTILLDGRVLFDSKKHINLPPQQRRVGFLLQQGALFPNFTVRQNIACGVRDKGKRKAVTDALLQQVHLEAVADKYPGAISGGEQQRAALARVLANEPEVLLLDEPFSALDTHLRFQLEQLVRESVRQLNRPAVLVSHNRDEAFRLADHLAVLYQGHLETVGEKHAVFQDPKTVNGARLTGCKNISPVQILDRCRVRALDWGLDLEVAGDCTGITHAGIRMHDIHPVPDDTHEPNTFLCKPVEEVENPFSITIFLRPEQCTTEKTIGMELPKDQWRPRPSCRVQLPPEAILLLRDSEDRAMTHQRGDRFL